MTTLYTNNTGIALSLAVWLATDDYDHSKEENEVSATAVLKPLRELVLARQNKDLDKVADVSGLVASRIGTAIHDSIEKAWHSPALPNTLLAMGYPKSVIERIVVNPTDKEMEKLKAEGKRPIPIYMEQRAKKAVGPWIVTGKFDFIAELKVQDFKSTGTYGYMHGSNVEKYMQQGSIYRWLNPDKIQSDILDIQLIFTDWSAMSARQNPNYPQSKLHTLSLKLMSLEDTEAFVTDKLDKLTKLMGAPQDQLPRCSDEDLWKGDDTYKYYKNPDKTDRATKNFTDHAEAKARLAKDGHVGVIKTFPGQVKKCKYCDVVGLCDQAGEYIKAGIIAL